MDEPKKISFGFSKLKKPNVLVKKPPDEKNNKIELIKCLEGQAIKLVVEKPQNVVAPLVIPLIGFSKTSTALASLQARKAILEGIETQSKEQADKVNTDSISTLPSDQSLETIEQRAARELIKEITDNQNFDSEISTLTLPILKADELPLNGAKESSMDDYESIPITQFGKAMLRGMGWKEEIKKKISPGDIDDGPIQRPKGMGLGADKAIKKHVALIPAAPNEILEIKKKAFVKILAGKHRDKYGQIEGFDDLGGRIVIKFALGNETDSIHEFMVQPVSKKEYQEYGKVINSAKYDEYKKRENHHGQIKIKEEDKIKLENYDIKMKKESEIKNDNRNNKYKEQRNFSSPPKRHRYSSGSSVEIIENNDEIHKRSRSRDRNMRKNNQIEREKNRQRNNSSLDSEKSNYSSPTHKRYYKTKKKSSKSKRSKKHRKQNSSSSENDKRHKKKTKKSKRSRSRSRS